MMTDTDTGPGAGGGAAKSRTLVLGGGLAGMAAAYELSRDLTGGHRVVLVESEPQLGGKARSHQLDGYRGTRQVWTDKGYHVFPHWYWDMWALLADAELISESDHKGCSPEEPCCDPHARFTCPHDEASRDYTLLSINQDGVPLLDEASFRRLPFRAWLRALRQREALDESVKPARIFRRIWNMGLLALVMLGLVGSWPERLKRRTLEDHLAGRWYAGEKTRNRIREIVLKALANPAYDASAFTTANTFRRWLPVIREANWRACRASLHDTIMVPLGDLLVQRGVEVAPRTTVKRIIVEGDRIVEVHVTGPTSPASGCTQSTVFDLRSPDGDIDQVILALPHRVLAEGDLIEWRDLTDTGVQAQRAVHELNYLPTAPMASLDLYFADLPKFASREGPPRAHFSLVESRFAITGFVASEVWTRNERKLPAPVLIQFVASDVETLRSVDSRRATEMLVEEIHRFIPAIRTLNDPTEDEGQIVEAVFSLNSGPADQLTKNEAGTWDRRPAADIGLSNGVMAGDFCLCPVDVASMEAAVSTGLIAANVSRSLQPYTESMSLPTTGVAQPATGMPESRMSKIVHAGAVAGTAVSFVLSAIIGVLMVPHTLARRASMSNLRGQPDKRRSRDIAMMAAGPVAAAIWVLMVIAIRSRVGSLEWDSNPSRADFTADGTGRWPSSAAWFIFGSIIVYLLLAITSVSMRRFLDQSRSVAGGTLMASWGYLLLPVLRCDDPCQFGFGRGDSIPATGTIVLIAGGALLSCVGAWSDLIGLGRAYHWVRKAATAMLALLVISISVALIQWIFGWFGSYPAELGVMLLGHIWVAGVTLHLLISRKEATNHLVGRVRRGRVVAPVTH